MIKIAREYIPYCFAALVAVSVIPLINLKIDRWRVLTPDYRQAYDIVIPHPRVNAAYLRTRYLIENKEKYDSVIFGSSRVFHGFGEAQLDRILGGKWYKLTYPGGAPYEHLHNLKALMLAGFRPKHVMIGIDDADMHRYRDDKSLYNFHPIPISSRDRFEFYKFYLFKKVNFEDLKILRGEISLVNYPWILEQYKEQGFTFPANQDVAKNARELTLMPPHGLHLLSSRARIAETVASIRAVSDLCEKNDIPLTLFVTPRYYKTYYARNSEELRKYKEELAHAVSFFDFSTLGEIAHDPSLWLDTSHFTSEVGAWILERVAQGPNLTLGFGRYITSENFDAELDAIESEALSRIHFFKEIDPKLEVHPSHNP